MTTDFQTEPFGVPLREVARVLNRSYDWTRRNLAPLGFTITPSRKKRVNRKPIFVPPGELRAFLAGGREGLKDYQREQRQARRLAAAK